MTISQDGRVGELITPLGKDVLVLQRFDGVESLGELFEFHVDALSEQENIDFDKAIGRSCTIKIKTYQDKIRVIDGILTDAQWMEKTQDNHHYRLVLRPWFALLGHRATCRTFLNKNVKDIITDVITKAGFSDYQFKTTADYDTIPYCVQYRETDLAFCSRLMEQHGIYYFFQHAEGKHTMMLADSRASHQANPDIPKLPYLPVSVRGVNAQQRIGSWSSHRRFRTGKFVLNDYDFSKPPKNLQASNEAAANYNHSKFEVYDWRGKYNETGRGENFAKIRLEAEQALDNRRHCAGDCPSAFPGSLINFEQHPTDAENAEYLIVRAHHRFGTQSYSTQSGGSGSYAGGAGGGAESYSGTYEFQQSDCPYRSQLRTEKPRIYGACVGLVVGDGEINTNQSGQVQVQFFWDTAQQSYWARVVQPWAGSQWGAQFIPRVGMEVLVEFEQGDPDHPVVVGCLYNGNNDFPYSLPGNKTQSGVKSNSSTGGGGYNELMFDDQKGSEQVRFHAQKDLDSVIENNETRQVGDNQTETIQNSRSTTIMMNDTLTIGMGRTATIGTNDTLVVGANRTATIGAADTVLADAMVTIVCGASSIVISPGSIIITSPSILLNGPLVMSGPGVIGAPPMPIV
jgi:type VI secretion system secreted protein VgrG